MQSSHTTNTSKIGRWSRVILFLLSAFLVSPALPYSATAASRLITIMETDLLPGIEFGWVRTQFFELDGVGGSVQPHLAVMDRWTHHSISTSWGIGSKVRVAESDRLPDGRYVGNLFLYNPEGGLVKSYRGIQLWLRGNVHIIIINFRFLREFGSTPPMPGFLPATEISHWTSEEVDLPGDTDIEHSKDPIQCPVNLAMHGLGCNGSFCDNVQVHCRAVAGVSTQNHRWTPFFSNETPTFEGCNSNEFATGLQCQGEFCDDISLRCTEHNAIEESCYVTDRISEDLPLTEFIDSGNGYVRRILCLGNNCDDKRLEICQIVGFPLYFGAFPNLCVTSVAGLMTVGTCLSAENGTNIDQVWHLDEQTGLISNPLNGNCLTALGGQGSITEEPCAEAGDTSWLMDVKGRLSSIGPNNDPLCLSVAGVQDPLGLPPIGAAMELEACSSALYQLFEESNAALPAPLPEFDGDIEEVASLPALLLPATLLLVGAISTACVLLIRRR